MAACGKYRAAGDKKILSRMHPAVSVHNTVDWIKGHPSCSDVVRMRVEFAQLLPRGSLQITLCVNELARAGTLKLIPYQFVGLENGSDVEFSECNSGFQPRHTERVRISMQDDATVRVGRLLGLIE